MELLLLKVHKLFFYFHFVKKCIFTCIIVAIVLLSSVLLLPLPVVVASLHVHEHKAVKPEREQHTAPPRKTFSDLEAGIPILQLRNQEAVNLFVMQVFEPQLSEKLKESLCGKTCRVVCIRCSLSILKRLHSHMNWTYFMVIR